MADKLFVRRIDVKDGEVLLGFAVGAAVEIRDVAKRRDLPGGLAEHSATFVRGEDRFELRAIADGAGKISHVIAGVGPVSDDWFETSGAPDA